jgi:hypothetical protein
MCIRSETEKEFVQIPGHFLCSRNCEGFKIRKSGDPSGEITLIILNKTHVRMRHHRVGEATCLSKRFLLEKIVKHYILDSGQPDIGSCAWSGCLMVLMEVVASTTGEGNLDLFYQ